MQYSRRIIVPSSKIPSPRLGRRPCRPAPTHVDSENVSRSLVVRRGLPDRLIATVRQASPSTKPPLDGRRDPCPRGVVRPQNPSPPASGTAPASPRAAPRRRWPSDEDPRPAQAPARLRRRAGRDPRGPPPAAPARRVRRHHPPPDRPHPDAALVAVLVLLGVITVIEVDNYRTAAASARAVTLALAVQDLVQELQTERGLTAGLLGGNVGFRDELGAGPQAGRRPARRGRGPGRRPAASAQDRVAAARARSWTAWPAVRAGTDAGAADRAADLHLLHRPDRRADQRRLRPGQLRRPGAAPRRRRPAGARRRQGEHRPGARVPQRRLLRRRLQAAASSSSSPRCARPRTRRSPRFDRLRHRHPARRRRTTSSAPAPRAGRRLLRAGRARAPATAGNLQVNPQSWWSALTTVLDDLRQLQQHVGSVIQARAATLQDQATRRMAVLLGAGAALLRRLGLPGHGWRPARSPGRWPRWPPRPTGWPASGCRRRCAGRRPATTDAPPPTGAGPGRRQRRDPAGRRRAGPGAGHRLQPGDRAGDAAPQHHRVAGQPRPPQPEPAPPPARLHHQPGTGGGGPDRRWPTCSSSTTWPPACAATRRACWCWSARPARGSGRSRCRSPT